MAGSGPGSHEAAHADPVGRARARNRPMIGLIASWLLSRNPALTAAHARRLAKVGLIVAGLLIAAAAFGLWLHLHTMAAVEADRSAAKAEALSIARTADERAHATAAGKSQEVEDANDRARDAARDSDDPLGDGLRSLRAEKN